LARRASGTADQAELARAVTAYVSSGRRQELVTADPRKALGKNSVIRHYLDERLRQSSGVFAAPAAEPIV
jgi:hypothetical protein